MRVYEAVFKDVHNRFVKERLTARDVKEARTQLRERGQLPLQLNEVSRLTLWVERMRSAIERAGPSPEEKARRKAQAAKKRTEQEEFRQRLGSLQYFAYEAINDDTREEVVGTIRAHGLKEARQMLREQRLLPKSLKKDWFGQFKASKDGGPQVKKQQTYETSDADRLIQKIFPPSVSQKDLTLMAQQLAAITQAGLPIVQALHLLRDTVQNKYLQKIITEMSDQIAQGVSFGECIKAYRDVFPSLFIELVDMGETTGNLDENMARLADYMAKQLELQQKVKGAMTYPLIVLGILVLIVVGLMIFIVPTFMKLFAEFKVELPLATQMLLAMSWFVTNRWYTIFLLPVFVWLGKLIVRTALFKYVWDKIEFKIPIFGPLNYKVTLTHMLNNMAISLRSGLTVIRALDSLEENVRNHMLKDKVTEITENVKMGARLGAVVLAADIFPPLVNRLIAVGDETGAMDDMLFRASNYMDNEVEQSVKALTSAIEPMMTLFLGGTVMFIVGALYFPLMGIMGGAKH
ncbi:MAG: type II secretion system F family protein [Candidatus Sericytochromatia bacterium]|nr:type II secretion system F family protein [Candidatus Sericytochromatia bacterium]